MGSERKSKEKTRKRSSASQSEDDGGHGKRHRRSSDEYGQGSSKRDKTEKSHHKSSKRDSTKEKKYKKERSKLDQHSITGFNELSETDYFSKNNEFATWLKEEKKKFFSDLSSDSARKLFSKFVEDWNSKRLDSKYYEGIAMGPRSSHKWKIKN